jgi:hypothetical protein
MEVEEGVVNQTVLEEGAAMAPGAAMAVKEITEKGDILIMIKILRSRRFS